MTKDNEIWVVIPAYNEGPALASVLTDLSGLNVVVVDDGSTDDTYAVALASNAHVCRHIVNLGQGAALQTGIDYALSCGAQWIITFDSDGQHRIEDAMAMVAHARSTSVEVVLGSRFLGRTVGMPIAKRWLLWAATLFTRLQTGLPLTDTHNGLRVLSHRAARTIRIQQNRMAHASEILDQIAHRKIIYSEYPCTIVYSEYSRAKGQRLTGMFRIVVDILISRIGR